jgi:hypothetical protein
MRLGKEKAAGYVEDTEVTAPEDVSVPDTPDTERVPVTAEVEQAAAAG